ncbi:hypothetical protein BpHYR1_017143 [Brachionus plicatilis]|uniref:Uncharacterized protein n=1 Tax=Brachionus plicatilis TaxID=10195 RepID=A0A3M7QKT6_BRAPC|nr:hypothetical protein BpHYR1_017143 [Brachionus plicatilis]
MIVKEKNKFTTNYKISVDTLLILSYIFLKYSTQFYIIENLAKLPNLRLDQFVLFSSTSTFFLSNLDHPFYKFC